MGGWEEKMDFIFGHTIGVLRRTLDVRAAQQKAIASNIANNETPGYRARDVDFKSALGEAFNDKGRAVSLTGTHPSHFGHVKSEPVIKMVDRPYEDNGFDDNSVDIEDEMARLSGNYMMYNVSSKILRKKFHLLMTAIKEGR
ncbi:MAG: flagellar basal body rod protein FlgB [Thermodesulfobacteriota bacterium]